MREKGRGGRRRKEEEEGGGGGRREEGEGSEKTREEEGTLTFYKYEQCLHLPVSRCSGTTMCSKIVFSNHSNRRGCECEGPIGCFFCTSERNTGDRLVGGTSGPWWGGGTHKASFPKVAVAKRISSSN